MCGIAGWIGENIDTHKAAAMLHQLKHRGPDSHGVWHDDPTVWIGHRRLSILDLSLAGHQPMISTSGRYVLSYNGEVYNYKSLHTELCALGITFRGHSDTEVILNACETWGIENAVRRFEGMFAFALYDRQLKTLYLARDHMGIKPLYYTQRQNEFAFASELSALRQVPWCDTTLNPDALGSYMRYLCVPAPLSIYKNIYKIPPGSILRFDGRNTSIIQYWTLPQAAQSGLLHPERLTYNDAVDTLEAKLRHSVIRHMQSDVPYGAFLSGGIDSSTIAALMQAQSARPIKTFTIGFDDLSVDESAHARAVSKHLGTDHYESILTAQDAQNLVSTISGKFDEPFADGSAVPTFLVSQFTRNHVTVCLSGDGGDELFGGYPRYFWADRIEHWRKRLTQPGSRVFGHTLKSIPIGFWDHIIAPMAGKKYQGSSALSDRILRLANYLATPRHQSYAHTMSAWQELDHLTSSARSVSLYGPESRHFDDMTWAQEMMLIDQMHYLPDDILTKVDRTSMAVSLEARVPFLTPDLVEWSWCLPMHYKLDTARNQGKRILRDVLYRYVPQQLVDRPKQGFGMPMAKWLRGPLRPWAESLLTPSDLEDCGLRPDIVHKIWQSHLNGQDHLAKLWTVLMLRSWIINNNSQALTCAA